MPLTTDDLAQRRAKTMAAEAPSPGAENQGDPAAPIRFTLRELLIAVTVIGVLLGLLRALGILGAVLAFVLTALFTWMLYPKWRPNNVGSQQAMFDFLWGVGMPLVCLVFDPFVFKQTMFNEPNMDPHAMLRLDALAIFELGEIYDYGYVIYAFVGGQMLVLSLLVMMGRRSGWLTHFLGGYLVTGALFAGLVGLVLLLPSIAGAMVMGIGLLGCTPILTAYVYGRRCRQALSALWSTPRRPEAALAAVLGLIVSLIGAFICGLALLGAVRGSGAVRALLRV